MSIGNYTLKIKELCDSLGSINVSIDDNKMVQICLGGLAPRLSAIRSTLLAREKSPSFFMGHTPRKGEILVEIGIRSSRFSWAAGGAPDTARRVVLYQPLDPISG